MTGFEVDTAHLRVAAARVDAIAARTSRVATELEGGGMAAPAIGDIRSSALFQQAFYDWVQTRFEDLVAAAHATTTIADNVRACADASDAADQRAQERLTQLLDGLASGGVH